MNLRNEQVPLICKVDGTKVEEFFEKEAVAAKYNAAVESAEFKECLEKTLKAFAESIEEFEGKVSDTGRLKDIISEENIMDNVRGNVMLNAISRAAEGIIFDGKEPETAVAEIITPDFAIQILEELKEILAKECASVLVAQKLGDALFKGFEDLFS